MDTFLDYNTNIFIQKETSENEKGVVRSEFDRREWDSDWATIKVILCMEMENMTYANYTTYA